MFKVGENFAPFLPIYVQAVNEHPEIMSGTFNAPAFKRDVNLKIALDQIQEKLSVLAKGVDDTNTAVGSDALIESLEVYGQAKLNEKKIPGLSILVEKMKEFFPRAKSANSTKQNPTT